MRFNVRLKSLGLFCIGWSHPSVLGPDIQFIREITYNGDIRVYIPGSSLKGALRSSASRIAQNYGFTSCGEVKPEFIEEAHRKIGVEMCDVCALFGYPKGGAPSPLIISNLRAIKTIKPLALTKVRIDDESMKVAEGALFTVEYTPPGSEFIGDVKLINPAKEKAALLLLSLAELRNGRFGRGSQPIDIKIENTQELENLLKDTSWFNLLSELKGWLWNEVL